MEQCRQRCQAIHKTSHPNIWIIPFSSEIDYQIVIGVVTAAEVSGDICHHLLDELEKSSRSRIHLVGFSVPLKYEESEDSDDVDEKSDDEDDTGTEDRLSDSESDRRGYVAIFLRKAYTNFG
ncbi:Protein of unknown function [Gryllus bimaculatus]|nr:Protein of unknown function [Gryllus bimaculatus]